MAQKNKVYRDDIVDREVLNRHLADNSVATRNIINANVTTAKIADRSVTSLKIAERVMQVNHFPAKPISTGWDNGMLENFDTWDPLDGDYSSWVINSWNIFHSAIRENHIQDSHITNRKLAKIDNSHGMGMFKGRVSLNIGEVEDFTAEKAAEIIEPYLPKCDDYRHKFPPVEQGGGINQQEWPPIDENGYGRRNKVHIGVGDDNDHKLRATVQLNNGTKENLGNFVFEQDLTRGIGIRFEQIPRELIEMHGNFRFTDTAALYVSSLGGLIFIEGHVVVKRNELLTRNPNGHVTFSSSYVLAVLPHDFSFLHGTSSSGAVSSINGRVRGTCTILNNYGLHGKPVSAILPDPGNDEYPYLLQESTPITEDGVIVGHSGISEYLIAELANNKPTGYENNGIVYNNPMRRKIVEFPRFLDDHIQYKYSESTWRNRVRDSYSFHSTILCISDIKLNREDGSYISSLPVNIDNVLDDPMSNYIFHINIIGRLSTKSKYNSELYGSRGAIIGDIYN